MSAKAIGMICVFSGLTAVMAAQPALSSRDSNAGVSERSRGQAPQPRVEGWPRENPPRPLPARPVTFPAYEIRKLANGMQVVLVHQTEQPVISVRSAYS